MLVRHPPATAYYAVFRYVRNSILQQLDSLTGLTGQKVRITCLKPFGRRLADETALIKADQPSAARRTLRSLRPA